MHAFGQTGVDLYADGVYRGTAIADRDAKPGKTIEHTYFKDQPRVDREITLYLPLYMPVRFWESGWMRRLHVQPAKPFAASGARGFLWHVDHARRLRQPARHELSGDSRPNARIWTLSIWGSRGMAGVNLNWRAPWPAFTASAFVLDFAQNNPTVDSLAQVYAPFLETIRSAHPETPILVITPIYAAHESWSRDARLEGMRELIRQVAAKRIAAGDHHLEIVEGTDLLGPSRGDGLVDGTHPNDLGFQWMAEGLAARLSKVFGLKPQR